MGGSPKIYEQHLYNIWEKQEFYRALSTVAGDEVVILNTGGLYPDLAGSDFKNAKIRVGNLTYVGDIEIDINYSDWKAHGHNINAKYNKVVLHACLINKFNQEYVYTKEGRKIPTINLSEFLTPEQLENIPLQQIEKKKSEHGLRCSEGIDDVDLETKENIIMDLGIERLNKKCKRIYSRLKELVFLRENHIKEPVVKYELTREFEEKEFYHEDFHDFEIWEQLFYELIFEALGYSKNKNIMLQLAQCADISFLKKLGHDNNFNELVEAAYFHISGLVPEKITFPDKETESYVTQMNKSWDNIKRIYDCKTFDVTEWHFFKLRPQNFPTIRIAGGTRLLNDIINNNIIDTIIKKVTEIRNFNVLINILRSIIVVKSDGYWKKHYVFDKPANGDIKYFVGVARADEIIINVIIPFFSVYFELFGNETLSRKIVKLYSFFQQKSENKIVHEIAENLNMVPHTKKTIYQQGMIELFRNFCSKGRCLECEIGQEVFG